MRAEGRVTIVVYSVSNKADAIGKDRWRLDKSEMQNKIAAFTRGGGSHSLVPTHKSRQMCKHRTVSYGRYLTISLSLFRKKLAMGK